MADTMAAEETNCKMVRVPGFATVWSEDKCIEATLLSPKIERRHVSEHKVNPIGVGRVLFGIPRPRNWILPIQTAFGFALIIDTIKADNTLEKDVQFRVAARILCHFE